MHKFNFKLKILVSLLIAAIVPFAITWVAIYCKINYNLERNFKDINYTYVRNEIGKVDVFFQSEENAIHTVAEAIPLIKNNPADLCIYINSQAEKNGFLDIFLITPNNEIYGAEKYILHPKTDYTLHHSYINAKKNQGMIWLEPYTDLITLQKCIGISMPIYDQDNNLIGVLVGNISEKKLGQMIESARYLPEVRLLLINASGYVKYDSGKAYSETVNVKDFDFITHDIASKILSQNEGEYSAHYQGNSKLCIFSVINSNHWKIVSLLDEGSFLKTFNLANKEIFQYIWVLGFLSIILAFGTSVFLSSAIMKPMTKLREGAHAISLGNLDYRIDIHSEDEIQDVADDFNQMSYYLKTTYDNLFNKTQELNENNKQLRSINLELEASYQQLEATMGQLNESEEKYRMLMSNISDMVFVINPEYELVYANAQVEKVLGFEESELIGKPVANIINTKSLNKPTESFFANDYMEFQVELLRNDERVIIAEGSTKRIIEDGRVTGIQAIARDITQRKHMENDLKSKYNALQVLNRVSKAITSTLELSSVLHSIVYQIIDLSSAVICTIRLFDKNDPNILILKAAQGVHAERVKNLNLDWREDHNIGQCVKTRQTITMELSEDIMPSEHHVFLYREEHARYITFIPLLVQGKMIGVLSIMKRTKPTEETLELLDSLANSIAIAIDNAEAYNSLKQAYLRTVQSLVTVVEAKDEYTESHSIRVAKYAAFVAKEMGYSKNFIEDIWVAGVLHDIGKIGISDDILNKKDRLTNEEYELVKQHPRIAHKILKKIGLQENIVEAVRHHHERYDGRGYPDSLKGEAISTMAAIISVADAFDAMTSIRSYKPAKSIKEGISEITANKGTQFDPLVADAFETAYLMRYDTLFAIHQNQEIEFF